MHYHIKDILSFIRLNDNSGLYGDRSNTKLRQYIRACLEKNRFYFVYEQNKLIGITEWYRVKTVKAVIDTIQKNRYLNSNPLGTVLWIHNMVFQPNTLTRFHYNKFVRSHKNVNQIVWWRHKTQKLRSHSIDRVGGT